MFTNMNLNIGRAAREAGVSPASIRRWMLNGLRGVRLQSMLIGGRRYTSAAAMQSFFDAVTAAADRSRPAVAVSEEVMNSAANAAGRRLDARVFCRKRHSSSRPPETAGVGKLPR